VEGVHAYFGFGSVVDRFRSPVSKLETRGHPECIHSHHVAKSADGRGTCFFLRAGILGAAFWGTGFVAWGRWATMGQLLGETSRGSGKRVDSICGRVHGLRYGGAGTRSARYLGRGSFADGVDMVAGAADALHCRGDRGRALQSE